MALKQLDYTQVAKILALEERAQTIHSAYIDALQLVRAHTYNVVWYDSLVRKAQSKGLEIYSDDHWRQAAIETVQRLIHAVRATHVSHFNSGHQNQDLGRIGQTSIDEGHLHALAGSYRQAQLMYRQARSVSEAFDEEGSYHSTQLDVVQSNWSLILTGMGRNATQFSRNDLYWPQAASTFALASWETGNYDGAAASLLHISYGAEEVTGPSAARPISSWINEAGQGTILVVSSILSFSRDNLRFALDSDPVFAYFGERYPSLITLVQTYLRLDLESFWTAWRSVSRCCEGIWLVSAGLERVGKAVARLIHGQYLLAHRSAKLSDILDLFASSGSRPDYKELTLIAEDVGVSLQIDTVDNTVLIYPRTQSTTLVTKQARLYVQTLHVLKWTAALNGDVTATKNEIRPKFIEGTVERQSDEV